MPVGSESPTRPRPPSLRLDQLGINPSTLVGKTLASVRRSPEHPALTMVFDDGSRVQVCVDGYDPVHRGLPKSLEMDDALSALFASERGLGLRVADCAFITLQDKAFAIKTPGADTADADRWDQRHLGVAFKFNSDGGGMGNSGVLSDRWHCVWATLQEHNDAGACVFRTYDDVYLEHLQPSSATGSLRKARGHARRKSVSPVKRSFTS
ncbi:hypothetical protein FB45DRAFT_188741 [Roridomyces roridus]|uniref:Uncharacterized protein n=1 Tax=Roridomyces roridus TaxID=1738132 RepID=A0AAD7CET8_9AGAR|nr:hypothetical protein FB45DRAFT_188741 [Roridomyces roridus]